MLTVYSTSSCPQCVLLKTRLKNIGLEFNVVEDESVMEQKGIRSIPQMETDDGKLMTYGESLRYLNDLEREANATIK